MVVKVRVKKGKVEFFKALVDSMDFAEIVGKHKDHFHDEHEVLAGSLEDMNDDLSDSTQSWNDLEIKMVRGEMA